MLWPLRMTKTVAPVIAAGSSESRSCDVDIEAQIERIGSLVLFRPEMALPNVDYMRNDSNRSKEVAAAAAAASSSTPTA